MEDYYEDEIVLALSDDLLQERFGSRMEVVKASLMETKDIRPLAEVPFLMSSALSVSGRIARNILRQAGIVPKIKTSSGNMETLIEMCFLGEGACFCPQELLRHLLAEKQLRAMTVLPFSNSGTRYAVKFGWPEREKPWALRSDFIRLAKSAEALPD